MFDKLVFVLLLTAWAAPSLVESCSCPVEAFQVSRSDAIRDHYCSTYSPDVYHGEVIGATCNCIPEAGDQGTSSLLNCQRYDLVGDTTVNASTLSRGQCSYERYDRFFVGTVCPGLGNALSGDGVDIRVSTPEEGELMNLTQSNVMDCNYACPFNARDPVEEYSEHSRQPCFYSVRIMETFKGNYSVGDVVQVPGPDVLTSCGAYGRLLRLGGRYVAGVGGACSPISEWMLLSQYTQADIQLLRGLRDGEVACGATTEMPSTVVTSAAVIASTTFLTRLLAAVSFI